RNRMRKNAYVASRYMIWNSVASSYMELYKRTIEEYRRHSLVIAVKDRFIASHSLPDVNLNHLLTLTDSTGVLQFAKYNIPDRSEGYTTDDNSRALLLALLNKKILNGPESDKLINTYLSFILHAYNPKTGLFRNFMNYERKWLEDQGSEECNANVLFVLGYLIKNAPSDPILAVAKNLFDNTIEKSLNFTSPRAFALILMGCILYLDKFSGAMEIKNICKTLSERLVKLYKENSDQKWKWFENVVTYNNGRLPQSLLMAGSFLKNKSYISIGLESLEWLFKIQYDKKNNLISLIGNNGWLTKGGNKAKYDQQPVEIPALIDACWQAYKITNNRQWALRTGLIFSWFLGNNDRHLSLYDYTTGGCFDGLTASVTNQNQGAESTIAWLLSLHRMISINRNLQIKQMPND
ncbi:MAG: glycosyl transferase family 1, partial [Ignavibacteria bacterium]|nr:glycosyl transferase family 1 [Ignavibacteria bacterium]